LSIIPTRLGARRPLAETTIDAAYLYDRSLIHPATFIRTGLLKRRGLYDERFCIAGDHDFFADVILRGGASLQYLPGVVSVFRLTGISAKMKRSPLLRGELREIRRRYFSPVYRWRWQWRSLVASGAAALRRPSPSHPPEGA
jgi:hypothetical protein